eukprot:1264865-Rhodomonas_salina.1
MAVTPCRPAQEQATKAPTPICSLPRSFSALPLLHGPSHSQAHESAGFQWAPSTTTREEGSVWAAPGWAGDLSTTTDESQAELRTGEKRTVRTGSSAPQHWQIGRGDLDPRCSIYPLTTAYYESLCTSREILRSRHR